MSLSPSPSPSPPLGSLPSAPPVILLPSSPVLGPSVAPAEAVRRSQRIAGREQQVESRIAHFRTQDEMSDHSLPHSSVPSPVIHDDADPFATHVESAPAAPAAPSDSGVQHQPSARTPSLPSSDLPFNAHARSIVSQPSAGDPLGIARILDEQIAELMRQREALHRASLRAAAEFKEREEKDIADHALRAAPATVIHRPLHQQPFSLSDPAAAGSDFGAEEQAHGSGPSREQSRRERLSATFSTPAATEVQTYQHRAPSFAPARSSLPSSPSLEASEAERRFVGATFGRPPHRRNEWQDDPHYAINIPSSRAAAGPTTRARAAATEAREQEEQTENEIREYKQRIQQLQQEKDQLREQRQQAERNEVQRHSIPHLATSSASAPSPLASVLGLMDESYMKQLSNDLKITTKNTDPIVKFDGKLDRWMYFKHELEFFLNSNHNSDKVLHAYSHRIDPVTISAISYDLNYYRGAEPRPLYIQNAQIEEKKMHFAWAVLNKAVSGVSDLIVRFTSIRSGDVKTAWKIICDKYEDKDNQDVASELMKFRNLHQRKGESVDDFAARIRLGAAMINNIGGNVSEIDMILQFAHNNYLFARQGYQSRKDDLVKHRTLDATIADARRMEATDNLERHGASSSSSSSARSSQASAATSGRAQNSNKSNNAANITCHKCQTKGHYARNCPMNSGSSSNNQPRAHPKQSNESKSDKKAMDKNGPCQRKLCVGSAPHPFLQCPITKQSEQDKTKKKSDKKSDRRDSSAAPASASSVWDGPREANGYSAHVNASVLPSDSASAFPGSSFSSSTSVLDSIVGKPGVIRVLIDSGASEHMLTSQVQLDSIASKEHQNIQHINTADGRLNNPVKGSVSLLTSTGQVIHLHDVLKHDSLRVNLLSAARLVKDIPGCSHFEGDAKSIRFVSQGGEIILAVQSVNNIYPTLLFTREASAEIINACVAVVDRPRDNDIALLHARTGHLGVTMLNRLIRTQAVHGVEGVKPLQGNIDCPACHMSKMTLKPQGKSVPDSEKAKRPFERINSDVQGPLSTESLSGGKYILVQLVDEFSHYVWTFIMRKRRVKWLSCSLIGPRELRMNSALFLLASIRIEEVNSLLLCSSIIGKSSA